MNLSAHNTRAVARFEFFDLLEAAGGFQEVKDRKVVSREAGYNLNSVLPALVDTMPVVSTSAGKTLKPRPAHVNEAMYFPGAER